MDEEEFDATMEKFAREMVAAAQLIADAILHLASAVELKAGSKNE